MNEKSVSELVSEKMSEELELLTLPIADMSSVSGALTFMKPFLSSVLPSAEMQSAINSVASVTETLKFLSMDLSFLSNYTATLKSLDFLMPTAEMQSALKGVCDIRDTLNFLPIDADFLSNIDDMLKLSTSSMTILEDVERVRDNAESSPCNFVVPEPSIKIESPFLCMERRQSEANRLLERIATSVERIDRNIIDFFPTFIELIQNNQNNIEELLNFLREVQDLQKCSNEDDRRKIGDKLIGKAKEVFNDATVSILVQVVSGILSSHVH